MIITIDGPAGTGKSTVARQFAERVGFTFFDTGAMYRTVTYLLLKEQVPFTHEEAIEELLRDFAFRIETHGHEKHYFIGNEEVTEKIRTQAVTRTVSEVAALPVVRRALVLVQRRFAAGTNAVFEGRDLGSVVFPNAHLKIYLTADPEVRAERRFREFVLKHPSEAENLTKQQVLEDLLRRDTQDMTREHSPLKAAPDAKIIDTSSMSIDQVVDLIFSFFQEMIV